MNKTQKGVSYKTNPKAETVLAANSGFKVKFCETQRSEKQHQSSALLQQHSSLMKEKAENKWGCSRKMWVCMWTPIFNIFLYKDMGSSFYWSFIKPDSSFSSSQCALILNSDIKGSCQTFSAQSTLESIWWEKAELGVIILIMAINCSVRVQF